MHVIDTVFLVIWAVFWLYWFASAIGVKSGRGRWGQFAATRIGIILIALLALRLGVLRGHEATNNPALWGIGLAVFLFGLGLAVWARLYLGRNWGMPMTEKAEPELVRTGPYRYVRHPIYSGILLGMAGTAVAVSVYWLIAVVVLGGYFIYSAFIEERNMTRLLPDAYPEYKRSTKMLIPFIF